MEYFEIALMVFVGSILIGIVNEGIASSFNYPKSSIAFKNIKSSIRSISNFGSIFSILFFILFLFTYFN